MFDRQRISYEPKWTIPLIDLSLDDKIAVEGGKLSFILLTVVFIIVGMTSLMFTCLPEQ